MTRSELEAFQAVVRFGSISAAADHIYLSQSALSRRILTLEKELGYSLFLRDKGFRSAVLTEEGRHFLPVSDQILKDYHEALSVPEKLKKETFRIGAIGSVASFLLPEVLDSFLTGRKDINLEFHLIHSDDGYTKTESGLLDFALISDFRYSRTVRSVPVWKEPYVLVTRSRDFPINVDPDSLNPEKEVRLPWSPEFDQWHSQWFRNADPYIMLDHMDLLPVFLRDDAFAIAPVSVASALPQVQICSLSEGPSDRIIYALLPDRSKAAVTELFQEHLNQYLAGIQTITLI